MLLSVVTVNWNSCADLAACLGSLASQTHHDLEVLIVDNGSVDGSLEMVRANFPQFILLPQTMNLGFAEGCNVGIARATGTWVAMLNNDAIADADWAERLVSAAERVPSTCGMLQSLMLFQRSPPTVNSTGIELTRHGTGRDRGEGTPLPAPGASWEAIFCPTGGAAAYRRTMLDRIRLSAGFFDTSHFCYYEDLDLGWRAQLAGYDAIYVPESVVHHKYHGSTERRSRSWLVRLATINRARTLLKNASALFLLRTLLTSWWQLTRLPFLCGPGALLEYAAAVRGSLRLRAEVGTLRRLERAAIEKRWVE